MAICVVTIFVLIYINYRVIKLVGTKDKALVSMLFFLKLSLFWFAYFFGV